MYIRKIAAAAGFACGAALTLAPVASASPSTDWWSSVEALFGGGSPAATNMADFQISFNGTDLFPTTDNLATATTVEGQYGLAIAYGDGANATAEGGIGNYALASGTDALAKAGSTAEGATTSSYNSAIDIGNNVTPGAVGAPDGAYAGGGSLIGNVDASAAGSSHNTAIDIGNNGLNNAAGDFNGGNSGSFAGDSGLIGYGNTAGNGDTAYTYGNINGFGDGSASVGGNNNYASTSGAETGQNEGGFAGIGNNNTAIADTSYTHDGDGVSATNGDSNYAYVYAPNNSTADASGGDHNIAYVADPYGNVNAPDSATAGTGNSDLAEVLYTHGDASAQGGNNLYDIVSLFGNSATPAEAGAASPAAEATSISSTVSGEISSLNSMFSTDATLFGVGKDLIAPSTGQPFETISLAGAPDTAPFNSFDSFLYGVDPASNASSDPGAYDLFNGALAKFDDAFNVGLYALENGGAVDPNAADFFGSASSIAAGIGSSTATEAFDYFYNFAIGDLSGFFGVDLSFLDLGSMFS